MTKVTSNPDTVDPLGDPSDIITKASQLKGRLVAFRAATPEEKTFGDEPVTAMPCQLFTLTDKAGSPALTNQGVVDITWAKFVRAFGSQPGKWLVGRIVAGDKATDLVDLTEGEKVELADELDELRQLIGSGRV
jgi:hypothetical protein